MVLPLAISTSTTAVTLTTTATTQAKKEVSNLWLNMFVLVIAKSDAKVVKRYILMNLYIKVTIYMQFTRMSGICSFGLPA